MIDRGLLATYVFVHEQRARLAEMLRALSPDPEKYRVFLMSTGSEATENCIKLSKTYALAKHGPHKKYFVTFQLRLPRAHHGRAACRRLGEGEGVDGRSRPHLRAGAVPDGYKNEDTSFDLFLKTLAEKGVQAAGHRRGDDGNLSGRRAGFPAGGVCAETGGVLPRARHRDVLRRSAGGLRPHRQDVWVRALRRPP